jgi:hypothetical protein
MVYLYYPSYNVMHFMLINKFRNIKLENASSSRIDIIKKVITG